MGVFISWSGENSPSHELAKALDGWIPRVLQHVDCYLSSKDTIAGTLWGERIMKELGSNNVGIVCLYSGNLESPWIHFEAGAIAAKTGQARLCPLLIDIEKKTGVPPPLGMFQVKTLEKDEMLSVMRMINEDGGGNRLPEGKLEETFDVWWPKLEPTVRSIKAKKPEVRNERSDREILEEILNTVRSLANPPILGFRSAPFSLKERIAEIAKFEELEQWKLAQNLRVKLINEVKETDPAISEILARSNNSASQGQPNSACAVEADP